MSFSEFDHQCMAKALQLAKKGEFSTSPNPRVGCVIAKGQQIIGLGWHQKAGQAHAEVNALQDAAEQAIGSTAYVTLEPCSHQGRTPPCASALIKARVKRVVCAMRDPNPLVSGRGIAMLEQAGIEVECGLLESSAEQLNPGFIKRMRHARPFIQMKLAATLDGKTSLSNGKSQWITGPAARADVQRLRARSCAIITGADTVVADNPSMNVRFSQWPDPPPDELQRQPMRIIIDSQNRITPEHQITQLEGEVLLVNQRTNPLVFGDNVSQYQAKMNQNHIDLHDLMSELARRQINHLWLEAGSTLCGAFMQAKLVDELVLYLAPKLFGSDAMSLLTFAPLTEINQAPECRWRDTRMVGQDLRLIAAVVHSKE